MRAKPTLVLIALLVAGPFMAGCSSSTDFDPTDALEKLDFFNLSKEEKLKGERKALFPEGVPGVSQGIPPDLIKGNKPVETAVAPQLEPEEKPKPKPRVVTRTPPKPTRVQVSPAQQPQQQQQAQQPPPQQQQQTQQQGAQSPWPTPQQQQTSPWPDAPAPNTFQR